MATALAPLVLGGHLALGPLLASPCEGLMQGGKAAEFAVVAIKQVRGGEGVVLNTYFLKFTAVFNPKTKGGVGAKPKPLLRVYFCAQQLVRYVLASCMLSCCHAVMLVVSCHVAGFYVHTIRQYRCAPFVPGLWRIRSPSAGRSVAATFCERAMCRSLVCSSVNANHTCTRYLCFVNLNSFPVKSSDHLIPPTTWIF